MYYNNFSWTDQAVMILRRLTEEGRPASYIGDKLGCSRNAVIGKAHRLHISLRNGKPANGAAVKSRKPKSAVSNAIPDKHKPKFLDRVGIQKARRERDAAGLAPTAMSYTPRSEIMLPRDAHRLSLPELTDKTCKWPIGDPLHEDFHFCGSERVAGAHGSYCSHHASIARGQGNRAEQHAIDGMGGRRL